MRFAVVLISVFLGFQVFADPMKYKGWKESQILEAQNEVLRISSKLKQSRGQAKVERASLNDERLEKSPEVTEKDLKRAQEQLEFARQLSFQDYAEVYVSGLQQNPEQFSKLVDSLSREELSQIMKILMKSKSPETNDAKRKNITPAVLSSANTP